MAWLTYNGLYKTFSDDAAKRGHDSHAGAIEPGQEEADTRRLAQECLQSAQKRLAAKVYIGPMLIKMNTLEKSAVAAG
jgi:hypothetical protein